MNNHSFTYLIFRSLIHAVPAQVEDIIVNPNAKTITWAAPAEPNGIIVGYRVQYWELGRRDTTEEVNTTAKELVYSYSNFSKYFTALTILNVQYNSNMTPLVNTPHRCRCASQGASTSCHCDRSWGEQSG